MPRDYTREPIRANLGAYKGTLEKGRNTSTGDNNKSIRIWKRWRI